MSPPSAAAAGLGPLQSGSPGPAAVLGTVVLFALYLSLTAHLAARNVLGDVPARRALYVGPLPAAVGVVGTALSLPALLTLPAALAVDAAAVHRVYGREPRLSASVTLIHFVVSVLLGIVLVGIAVLWASRPT